VSTDTHGTGPKLGSIAMATCCGEPDSSLRRSAACLAAAARLLAITASGKPLGSQRLGDNCRRQQTQQIVVSPVV
jgi:hypothetical protein